MKKNLLLFIYLCLFCALSAKDITIGSFNILGSRFGKTANSSNNINAVAEIINSNKMDIVLFQELRVTKKNEASQYLDVCRKSIVNNNDFPADILQNKIKIDYFEDLIKKLQGSWDYCWSFYAIHDTSVSLHNAILFRTDILNRSPHSASKIFYKTKNERTYEFAHNNVQIENFFINSLGNKYITIINVHCSYEYEKWQKDLETLKKFYNNTSEDRYNSIVVIGGDFNSTTEHLHSKVFDFSMEIQPNKKTTINKNAELVNEYDHFVYPTLKFTNNPFIKKIKEVDYAVKVHSHQTSNEARYPADITIGNKTISSKEYFETVSDHLPIKMIIELK